MKKTITLFVLLAAATCAAIAQPVITSTSVFPSAGTADSVYFASATVPPGASGAGVTWNLSALSMTMADTLTWVTASSSPYASTFPTANLAFRLGNASSTGYNYMRTSSAGMETEATGYGSTGAVNYSPNARLAAPYPFHYLDVAVDTYQTTTSGPQVETLTYDGYGTLVTSIYTYYNVIRVKEDYGGADYHYAWYTTNPLQLVMDYSNSGNNYVFIAATPPPTAVSEVSPSKITAQIFPNPSRGGLVLVLNAAGLGDASLLLTDATGRIVKQAAVNSNETQIARDGLPAGIYFYQVYNDGARVANGKIILQ